MEALCRRVGRGSAGGDHAPTALVSGEFILDENRRLLLKAGRPIELTQVEFQIMELFFHSPGTALSREKILKGVWGRKLFRGRQDRGRQHPPPADEDRGRALPPGPHFDGVGLWLPLGRVTPL